MTLRYATLALYATLPAALLAQAAQPPTTNIDVPVRSVVLFSSGVGYFEHGGTVRGNAATELRFKTDQINDILKSLVLQDSDGGRVTTITYPSQDPLAKTLRSFQVDITGNPGMAELLNQLRGARVTLQSQAERLSGTVLGVEMRLHPQERGAPIASPVLNVMVGVSIRSIELQAVSSLTFDDAQLQDELMKALAALSQARDHDRKPVTINFTGSGDRRVSVGYVVEAPVWKTSYRLLLGDGSARVQGWAIVENQTESDWNNVSLSLVSGRPMSFAMDLYQPLYATRPTVVPRLFAGLAPRLYEGATDASRPREAMADTARAGRAEKAGGPKDALSMQGTVMTSLNDPLATAQSQAFQALAGKVASLPLVDNNESVQSLGSAAQLGELFQYSVGNVTLARQKSAMLPIVADSVEAERVSIYNAAVIRTNPLNGVRVRNTTGKHFLQGPVTVLDGGSYAGDARIDDVPPGQERLISYGIDLEMTVDNTRNSSNGTVLATKISKGSLMLQNRLVTTMEYQADNKSTRDKTLIIEHPFTQGWKLIAPEQPLETTRTLYRFRGLAAAGKVTTLTVTEERVQWQSLTMLSANLPQLISYSTRGELEPAVREAVIRAIQMRQGIIDLEKQVADRAEQLSAIAQEQERIRENMRTVGQSTQYYERLLAKLNQQESQIELLQRERESLQQQLETQRTALADYLGGLTIGG
jgi:hypothetical protein